MFDVGLGEVLLLAVLALLVFGPEKLPGVAADAGRWVKRMREMADTARREITNSAGPEVTGLADDLRSVADLHPKRVIASAMADAPAEPQPRPAVQGPAKPVGGVEFDPEAT